MIRKFASELESWLQAALDDLPENLRAVKIDRKNFYILNRKKKQSSFFIFGGIRCITSGTAFLSHATTTKFAESAVWDRPVGITRPASE